MSTARGRESGSEVPQPREVAVVVWPLRDGPLPTLAVGGITARVSWGAGWWAQSGAMGGLALGVFLLALWRLWLPVTYQLGSKGVVERACGHSRHIDWLRVTRAELQPRGVLLLADRTQTPLAIIHGVFVPWRNKREQVIALIEHFAGSRIHDVS
jgi:hypothetical protein